MNKYRMHAWTVTEDNPVIVPGICNSCNTHKKLISTLHEYYVLCRHKGGTHTGAVEVEQAHASFTPLKKKTCFSTEFLRSS